jgi:Cellulase M and related proteins
MRNAFRKSCGRGRKEYADEVRTDVHGNVIAALNPDGKPRVMLAGHCDQIGLMVQHIDEQGFLYVNPIGGFDMQVLIGQPVVVWTQDGPINGVIARKPIHLLTEEERKQIPKFHEIWVDIGAKDGDEAKKLVRIGDPITFRLEVREMSNGFINAPGIDDKVGAWTVMETLRLLSERKGDLKAAVFAVSTVQEEVGLRGAITSAFGIAPDVGIAVDVTFATDHPATDKRQVGDIKLGAGPVIYRGPNINPSSFGGWWRQRNGKASPTSWRALRARQARTPMSSKSAVPAWRQDSSASPTATCIRLWRWWR